MARQLRSEETSSPIKVIVSAIAIAIASLIVTLFIPAIVAHTGDVFYAGTIINRLPLHQQEVLKDHDSRLENIKVEIEEIERRIDSGLQSGSPSDLRELFEVREKMTSEFVSITLPIVAIPYYLNPQMLLWPIIYTCLGWLILLLRPSTTLKWRPSTTLKVMGLGLLVYAFYEWPLWLRNFVLSSEGRVVYAYPNYDVHPASFFAQEATIYGFCLLLAIVWCQWSSQYKNLRDELGERPTDPREAVFDGTLITILSDNFYRWLIASIILGLGFLPFLSFFWNIVAEIQDQRYLLSAILAQMYWGITWIMISLPLITAWREWGARRIHLIQYLTLTKGIEEKKVENEIKLISEFQPVRQWGVVAVNAAALISFASPILQAFAG